MGGKITPVYNITAYQGYADDAVEGSATTLASNWTQNVDENFRTRFVVAETAGGLENNVAFQFQYRHIEGTNTWTDITTTSSVIRAFSSIYFSNGGDTTQQVGSGTFITPNGGFTHDGTVEGVADYAGNDETETECCMQVRSADVTVGDTIEMRVTIGGAAPSGTPTLPTITANAPTIVPVTGSGGTGQVGSVTIYSEFPALVTVTGVEATGQTAGSGGSGQATYLFDGHVSTENNGLAFINFANAYDTGAGYDSSYATCNAYGSLLSNYGLIEGTQAPTSGGTITLVEARVKYDGVVDTPQGDGLNFTFEYNGESLGYIQILDTPVFATVTNWITLSTPTGGWSWTKVSELINIDYIANGIA